MAIVNLGSINLDHVHLVSHFPRPGETLADTGYSTGLGGKGLNISLAARAAGARVIHTGAVGRDGLWAVERLTEAGVETDTIATVEAATGRAVILVNPEGENLIVIHGGANRAVPAVAIAAALERATPGDWFLTQNETSETVRAASEARARGLRVAYAAAPFDFDSAAAMLPHVDLIAVNAGEAEALTRDLGQIPENMAMLVTRGAEGALYRGPEGAFDVPAFRVTPVDTTGAGDCFAGYFLASLDAGAPPQQALRRAAAAAAISVTRPGAADSIPSGLEVDRFLADHAA